ncbi:MAG TPA: DIP1984 family protein, partial [Erysipelotrichaceae bacterium]|nr:DIP1984 family protein [Erysipelotrichaceae bacterium]
TIIKAINKTNNETVFDETMMLYEALVKRDEILSKRNILISAADHASDRQDRYSLTEIKYVSVINVENFQKEADKLAKKFRELDTKIQGLNWNTDLI